MTPPPPGKPPKRFRISDIRGVAKLIADATAGVTRIAEGMHRSVWDTMGIRGGAEPGRTRGITGLVYKSVHAGSKLVGGGIGSVLSWLEPLFHSIEDEAPGSPRRQMFLAALNGVMGDRLVESESPFAIAMSMRTKDDAIDWGRVPAVQAATGKALLLVHGLCGSDLQWRMGEDEPETDLGDVLATCCGYSQIFLRYNSGLHVSTNGRELASQLERLAANWPVELEEITVVAHSMGGLLIRSACHYARQQGLSWPARLRSVVFLGTPHHGAPLERAGNWVDVLLARTPHTAPLAKLGKLRSAGITDLRYGNLVDEDWMGRDRFERTPDDRMIVPLLVGVRCFAVAATKAKERTALADHLVGDGLVPVRSALGEHDEPERRLEFAAESQWIVYRTNHMDLLNNREVTVQVVRWLAPESVPKARARS